MRFGRLAAAAALVCAVPAGAVTYTPIAEVEPNDSFATAQNIPLTTDTAYEIRGSLEGTSTGFVDYFRVTTGSLACTSGLPSCYTLYFDAAGVGGNQPFIDVFRQDGSQYFSGFDVLRGSIGTSQTNTPFVVAVRRNSTLPAVDYSLFLRLTYSYAPEPASWVMMIFGIGVVGAAARQRRARRPTFA